MKRLLPLLLVLALSASALLAQLTVNVGLVNIVATVTDDRGRYIDYLSAEDFVVKEDGEVQRIAHFTQSRDLPVSMGILLDTSGSMQRKIDSAAEAVRSFARTIHEDDDIFLMTFDSTVRLRQDFTDDRGKLNDALRRLNTSGGTSLYDAVIHALRMVREGRHEKQAILLITDGEDTSSHSSFREALDWVREAEVMIYALGTAPSGDNGNSAPFPTGPAPGSGRTGGGPSIDLPFPFPVPFPFPMTQLLPPAQRRRMPQRDGVDMSVLEALATASGGRSWLLPASEGRGRDTLHDALEEIAAELRNQYSIGYYPPHSLQDGQWHRIQIETVVPGYHVRHRGEYFAGDSQAERLLRVR